MGNSLFSASLFDNRWLRYGVFSGAATFVLLGALVGALRYAASEQHQNELAGRLPITWAKTQAQFFTTDTSFRDIVRSAPDTWMADAKKFDRIEATFEKNRTLLAHMLSDVRNTAERQGQHSQLMHLDGDLHSYKTLTNEPDEVTLAQLNSLVNSVNEDFDALENSAAASLERNRNHTNFSALLQWIAAIAFGTSLCAFAVSVLMYFRERNVAAGPAYASDSSMYSSAGSLDILSRFSAATSGFGESAAPAHAEPQPVVADASKSAQLAEMVTEVREAQQVLESEPVVQPQVEPELQPAVQAAIRLPDMQAAAQSARMPEPAPAAKPEPEPAITHTPSIFDVPPPNASTARLPDMAPAIPATPRLPRMEPAIAQPLAEHRTEAEPEQRDPLFAALEASGHENDVHVHDDHIHGAEFIAEAEAHVAYQPPRPMEPANEDSIQIDTTINQFTQQTQRLVSALFSLNAVADSTMSLAGTLADALDRSPDRAEVERVSAELHRLTTAMLTTVQQLSGNTIRMQNQVAHMMKSIEN